MSQIWTRIKKMKGNYCIYCSPCLMQNGNLETEAANIAELLADHYEEVSHENSYDPLFLVVKRKEDRNEIDISTDREYTYNEQFSLLEFENALKQCSNSAPGSDSISYNMIRNLHVSAKLILLQIYNIVWTKGVYHKQWRSAVVLSFLKPEKPADDSASYRPIALTSCVGKLMEKMVNTQLVLHLEADNLLPLEQYGFRKMHSTTDALVRVTSDIYRALENQQSLLFVFFDMQKAYDSTWRYFILQNLYQSGLPGHLAKYIKNFLMERKFLAKTGNKYSTEHVQHQGVPQGSVISCTLFSLAINEILGSLPQHVKGSLYVDDCMVFTEGAYFPALERRLQGADRSMMLRVYRAIFRTKLDYGSVLYDAAPFYILQEMVPVHNAALRFCTGAFRSSPVISIYTDVGEPPLHIRRKQLLMQYYALACQQEHSHTATYVRNEIQNNNRAPAESITARISAAIQYFGMNAIRILYF